MRNLIVAASVIGASGASAQEKLKFAVFTPEAEMTHQIVMKPWAERVNKDSNGTLDIQTFPNGALGRNPGLQTKMLQDGVADIAWVIPSYTPGVYLDDRTSSRIRWKGRWPPGICCSRASCAATTSTT